MYDADGNLLIRPSEGGERVLYAGATELHLKADGGTWAQHRYTAGEATVAVRSNESGKQQVFYQAGDHHGTQSLSIGADRTQAVRKRYLNPFGAERGKAVGTWPDDKGFLGMTADKATGLTHVGAREYDPVIGQFVSVDPVLDSSAPQTLNGYSYASNNPVSFSDPTGLHQMMQNGGGDDSNAQNDFIESHASPNFGSGATWSSTYNNFAGGGGGGGGTAQGWVPAAKPCGVVPMAPCAGTAPLVGPAPIFLPYIHPGVASPQYQMTRYCGAYPIDRACNPQDAVRGGGNDSLQKIVGKFMLGKLDRYETYGEDSRVALQVMMTDLTAAHRAEIAKRYYDLGKKSGSLDPNSIGGKSTSGKAQQLGSDAKSVLTGDANVATAILGSYTTKCEILRANSSGIQARVTIHNSMSVSSRAVHQQDMTVVFRAVIPARGGVLGGTPVQ